MLSFYLKRILKSKLFYLCLAVTIFVLLFGASQILMRAQERAGYNEAISILETLFSALELGGFYSMIAPALMSITFLFFYTEDMEKRTIYYQMLRGSRRKYYSGQITSALMSAGIMIAIALAVLVIVSMIAGVTWEHNGWWTYLFEGTNTEKYYYGDDSWKLTLWHLVLVVFYSLPWPLVGLIVSLFTKNRYVIMASPFVVFLLWNYIAQYIRINYEWFAWFIPTGPMLWIGVPWMPNWSLTLTFLYPICYHVVFIGGLSLIYLLITKRRYVREGL